MQINVTFDQNVNTLPVGFVDDVNATVGFFESMFNDSITFNLHVGFGERNGVNLGANSLGESNFFVHSFTYSQIKTALAGQTQTANDATAIATLPATDPFPGTHDIWLADPQAQALGLLTQANTHDQFVGFSDTAAFDYDRSNGIANGQFDFIGTVAHEISEIMGRVLGAGQNGVIGNNASNPDFFALDLFHYSAFNTRDFTRGGYFSFDNGATDRGNFNTSDPTGDAGDWAATTPHDSFLDLSFPGGYNNISLNDLREMDVIGYHRVDDFGDDTNFAGPGAVNGSVNGTLEQVTDSDWFRVQLNGGVHYIISVAGADAGEGTLQHPFVAVFNSASTELAFSQESDVTNDARLHFTPGNSGFFYVDASSFFGGFTGTYTVTVTAQTTDDFNFNGTADLLLRNDDGRVAIWEMNGQTLQDASTINPTNLLDPSWHNAETGDFNGDGMSDILFRNDDGRTAIWEMNGFGLIKGTTISGAPLLDSTWHIAGTGDFNNDHDSDVLLRNDDGRTAIWEINGTALSQGTTINGAPILDASWHVEATGDFNGDGKSDIVLRNDDGRVSIWQMDGTTLVAGNTINSYTLLDSTWHIAGTGDFNSDNHSDILLRNDDGRLSIWEMNGFTLTQGAAIGGAPLLDATWHIEGTDDFTGEGKSDILLRNDDGRTSVWEMNGFSLSSGSSINGAPLLDSTWHVENHQHDLTP